MIYTLTLSPSIDYIVHLDQDFQRGIINRISSESICYGGKGVNVSQVLLNLGVDNTALGFIAGFTGDEIEKGLAGIGVKTDFVRLDNGHSRINVKIKDSIETEMNAKGPKVNDMAMKQMYDKIGQIKEDDILVIAGGVSGQMPQNILVNLVDRLPSNGTKVIVDTTGENFVNILSYHPFLVKPNHIELGELIGEEISPLDRDSVIRGARLIREKGARNVLVSLASEGALLLTEDDRIYESKAPAGTVKNSVGAGDSMLAGFIAGYLKEESFEDAFYMGLAAGTATAFMDGLAGKQEIEEYYRKIRKPS